MEALKGCIPDISSVVDSLDRSESWTRGIDEMPEEFTSLVAELPALASIPPSDDDADIISRLPRVLAQVTSTVFAACMITLERGIFLADDREGISWASMLYLQCKVRAAGGHATQEEKLIVQRFETIVRYIQSGNLVLDPKLTSED